VTAPGSVHPKTGKLYKIVNDAPIIEAPNWLIDWLSENCNPKPVTDNMPSLNPDFDAQAFFKHWADQGAFEIVGYREWHGIPVFIPDHCIIAGVKHKGSNATGLPPTNMAQSHKRDWAILLELNRRAVS
jgi:hypothetical protein